MPGVSSVSRGEMTATSAPKSRRTFARRRPTVPPPMTTARRPSRLTNSGKRLPLIPLYQYYGKITAVLRSFGEAGADPLPFHAAPLHQRRPGLPWGTPRSTPPICTSTSGCGLWAMRRRSCRGCPPSAPPRRRSPSMPHRSTREARASRPRASRASRRAPSSRPAFMKRRLASVSRQSETSLWEAGRRPRRQRRRGGGGPVAGRPLQPLGLSGGVTPLGLSPDR